MRRTILLAGVFSAVALMAAFSAVTAQAAHLDNPNKLSNAGFETPIADTEDPFVGRWQPFSNGPTSETGMQMPRTGDSALEMTFVDQGGAFAGAFQDVPVSFNNAGNRWWFSGWHKLLAGDPGGTEIRIEWRDSVNDVEITRTPNATPTLSSDYEEFILSDLIPAGANIARVVYATQSFGGVTNQTVLVDDLNFNNIPEPASFSLLALAGLALVARRRRS